MVIAQAIDRVHLEIEDRDRAADWYGEVFGLTRPDRLAFWAEDPMGPLILGVDGQPMVSLFAHGCAPPSRDATVAFRTDAAGFLRFLDMMAHFGFRAGAGQVVTQGDVVDHALSCPNYISDPDGNRLELTTYDHAEVERALTKKKPGTRPGEVQQGG